MSDKDFPNGRKVEWISWGVSPENGDCLALQKVGSGTCISLEAHSTYHGEYDIPFIVAKHRDGQEVWHRAAAIDSIGWQKEEPQAMSIDYHVSPFEALLLAVGILLLTIRLLGLMDLSWWAITLPVWGYLALIGLVTRLQEYLH